jgi:hypothetical protein
MNQLFAQETAQERISKLIADWMDQRDRNDQMALEKFLYDAFPNKSAFTITSATFTSYTSETHCLVGSSFLHALQCLWPLAWVYYNASVLKGRMI